MFNCINKILPLEYNDSLSYLEQLCHMNLKINEIIKQINIFTMYKPKFCGYYDPKKSYDPLSVVEYNNDFYMAVSDVPIGVTPDSQSYWLSITTKDFEYLSDLRFPDNYDGQTDSEKMQNCLDDCSNGGIIIINREYVITSTIDVKHISSSKDKFIFVIGIGKDACINFDGASMIGNTNVCETWGTIATGGMFFSNLNFIANGKGIITDYLIRMFFTNCHFYNGTDFFYGNDSVSFKGNNDAGYAQSYYFTNCYFGLCNNKAFNVFNAFDIHFNNCIFEYKKTGICTRGTTHGLFITNCLLENMDTSITLGNINTNVDIRDCYFEDNTTTINLQKVNYKSGTITISNNIFVLNSKAEIGILMPHNLYDANNGLKNYLIITGNGVEKYNDANMLYYDEAVYRLDRLIIENNNFDASYGNKTMAELRKLGYKEISPGMTFLNYESIITVIMNSDGTTTNSFYVGDLTNLSANDFKITRLLDLKTGREITDAKYHLVVQGNYAYIITDNTGTNYSAYANHSVRAYISHI